MASNRSPSPLSSRNCRNSETNSTPRRSFNGTPFSRPSALVNPKSSNAFTPANTPTSSDLTKRNLITRKSVGGGPMFQDGKENRKDALRSPAKVSSKNFMSPTISAASKFTPSPRKKILGEKNDVTRASIELFGKDSDLNSEPPNYEPHEPKTVEQIVEQKEHVVENVSVDEVNLGLTNDDCADEVNMLLRMSNRPLCCSPVTSDSDPNFPPYDPKKNYLSPRPQFLYYKPNPRIEYLLNKEANDNDDCEESDVTRLEESFNLSDSSSETEEAEETEQEQENEKEKEAESSDVSDDSVHGSSVDFSEPVLEEKPIDLKVDKALKPRFLTRSKTISFVFVLFLVACFSLSFNESPPIGLPIYEDVGFKEVYHESLRVAAFAKERFDNLVANVKQWSMDMVSSYLSHQKSHSIQFINLTITPIQEEFQFNRHIGTDIIQQVQEFEEETERMEEEEDDDDEVVTEEMEDESDVVDEVVTEESVNEQIESDVDEVVTEEPIHEQVQSEVDEVQETKSEATQEAQSEMVQDEVETKSSVAETKQESEALSSFSTQSIATICVAGFSMVVMAAAAVVYMNQKKSNDLKTVEVNDDNMREESGSSERSISSSVQKGTKKKTNNKRESLASSSSEFSMCESFGSFTTFERIALKHKDEVMLTPIRRSSRLLKNQVVS